MPRPANFPPGVRVVALPDERPTCHKCKCEGDDNWWHLDHQPTRWVTMRSAFGSCCNACMVTLAALYNSDGHRLVTPMGDDSNDDFPPE